MKKSSLRSLTSALALSVAITLHVLPSCKSVNPSLYTNRDSVAYTITIGEPITVSKDTYVSAEDALVVEFKRK